MPPRLIVNADDFGLTPGVNRAIEELHHAGVVTSATLMATGPAFPDAIAIAHRNPALGIGCHIVMIDGAPACDPRAISTLLGPDRRNFRRSLASFAIAVVRGQIDPDHITQEAIAQIRRIQDAGVSLSHVDTHKHTHLFPAVLRPLLRALELTGIPAIRNPFEPRWTHTLGQGGLLRRTQLAALRQLEPRFQTLRTAPIRTTDGSIGVSATGDLTRESLTQLLGALPGDGTFELVCHPGYNDPDLARITTRLRQHREVEYQALLTCIPQRLAHPNPPELISYQDL